MKRVGFVASVLFAVAVTVVGCMEKTKRTSEETPIENTGKNNDDTVSKRYVQKIVPQLRAVFSILSKIMIIAERSNGSSDDTQTAIGVLEDLASESGIGKITDPPNGLKEVEVSLVFGRMFAQKKANISFIVVGKESSDDFLIDSIMVNVERLEAGVVKSTKRFNLIEKTSTKSLTEAGSSTSAKHKLVLSQIQALSNELAALNPKIRSFSLNGDLAVEFNKEEMIATSSGLQWKDKKFNYNLASLRLITNFDGNPLIREVNLELKMTSEDSTKPLNASLKLNSSNVTLEEVDRGFIIEK